MNTNFDYSEYLLQPLSLSIYYLSPQVELLKKLYTSTHPAYNKIYKLQKDKKRERTKEIKGASPIITSNIQDPTQSEPNKQRTLENQEGEPSSKMVLRNKRKVFYDKSSESDDYVKNLRSKRYVRDKPVSHHDYRRFRN
ncbi:hypothetical protein F8M41_026456 [Gigaspora margarita]|uniref:Uncharacterized protein n=1 Tax=Gigaspora margarita TaxID=4874 RepID=A0A8H4AAH6_GIGMA|nr:hypothetical protein F8M41_026456 [Gigaspora margarita]